MTSISIEFRHVTFTYIINENLNFYCLTHNNMNKQGLFNFK